MIQTLPPRLHYVLKRLGWYLVTFVVAITLNFILPRLGPTNPIDTIMTKLSSPGMDSQEYLKMYEEYLQEFNLDKPLIIQLFTYFGKTITGDLGVSFTKHPLSVWSIITHALPWTLLLQIPALLLSWIVGNVLGALAAYKRGIFDKALYPLALLFSSIPYFCFAIILVYAFGIHFQLFPPMGAYGMNLMPSFSWAYITSVARHYILPFTSLFLILAGGQAIGMRSMSIYELGTDYIKYAKQLGIKERGIVGYVFRNAMLPQLTGLALSLGLMVGGALITEIVFSYPGLGMALFNAIRENDYPVIQGCTLLITVCVLAANFTIDVLVGFFDPRIKAAQQGQQA
ncbi:MAG: ABC transporter permease subunit [Chitinivibrionales bacterium]|nr:ABC transporter permease subunit [Chitinivibrionales bacterium]